MKVPTERHYMPLMPILYWAQTFRGLRRYILDQHPEAESFERAVYSDIPFDPSKFNAHPITFVDYDCLGLYANLFEGDRYIFRHADKLARNPFKQFHSWTEWRESTPKILQRCLAGEEEVSGVISEPSA
jgi:hypothetical protein